MFNFCLMGKSFKDNYKPSISQLVGFVKDSYLDRTSRPIYAIAYLLFFLVVYEVGIIVSNPEILSSSLMETKSVVAFEWGRELLRFLGFSEKMTWIATPLTVVVILLALQITSKTSWRVRFMDFGPMSAECILLAVPLIVLSLGFNRSISSANHASASCQQSIVQTEIVSLSAEDFSQSNAQQSQGSLPVNVVTGIGAGIYEEFVFRLILICLLMLLFQDMIGISWQSSVILSVSIAAILFSVHHHIFFLNGQFQTGEPFTFSKFIFRTLAGVYFAIVFAIRGFGVTAGTHAFYNIIAVVLNACVLS